MRHTAHRRRRRVVAFWLPAAGCWLLAAAAAHACPGCKDALVDPDQLPQRLAAARGFAVSIGVLLSVPFLLIGGVTAAVVRSARRHPR